MTSHKSNFQRDEALSNIDRKINILESWVKNGIPFKTSGNGNFYVDLKGNTIFDFFPTSIRQFNYWDASQNCEDIQVLLPRIRSNNNSTLTRYLDRVSRVKAVIDSLQAKKIEQEELSPKKKLNKYEAQLAELNQNLESALSENQLLLLEIRELKNGYSMMKRSLESIKSELSHQIKSLQKDNSDLESEKRSLLVALAKVRPLKRS